MDNIISRSVDQQAILECNDTATLLDGLRECTVDWMHNIAKMALYVRRLDELGVEVAIENSALPFIRLIAHGQLSANLYLALSGDGHLLERAMRLPMPMQERIADNEPLRVMLDSGDHRMVRPLDMTRNEQRQVFHGKRLRTDAEQVGWLADKAARDRAKQQPPDMPSVTVDHRKKGIVVKGVFIAVADLANYVASLNR